MKIVCATGDPVGHVLVIHSWWGLTRSFHDYAALLADKGYAVGLSDLYDGKIAKNIEETTLLRRMPRKQPMYRMLMADIARLCDHGDAKALGVIGFSMGGHWAVWLSQQAGLPIHSTVLYYAVRAGDFSASRSSFLAHYADEDSHVRLPARKKMERALEKAGLSYVAHDYPGTGHWFAETAQKEAYQAAAAQEAFNRTLNHLNHCLT